MALVSLNDSDFGADSITLDTSTGLEWLDVPTAQGLTFLDVVDEFGPGGDFEGFRHATEAEFEELIVNAGIPDLEVTVTEDLAPFTDLIDLVGATDSGSENPQTLGFLNDVSSPSLRVNGDLDFFVFNGEPAYEATTAVSRNESSVFEAVGHWLVRSPSTEPFDIFIDGDDRRNLLTGTIENEVINGFGGNDRLFGDGGNDILNGAAGVDRLFGGEGNDILNGGLDNDRLFGDGGNDILNGSAGLDFLFGGEGEDILNGGLDNDRLLGGANSDTFVLAVGEGTDIIQDFELGVDFIGLAAGLSFEDLTLTGNSILVNGEELATFRTGGIAENLDQADFISV